MLDAPVSGGEIGAINATLSIMVGGDQAAFDAVKPILDVMGNPERVIRIGDSGAGQICKVCNQMVIGGTLAAVSEAFALARKAQVDVALVREALLGGFAASKVLDVHGQRMLAIELQAGLPREALREGPADRQAPRWPSTRPPLRSRASSNSSSRRCWRTGAAKTTTPASRPCCSAWPG